MFIVGNFVEAVANIVSVILTVLYWLIIFRAIISWVNPDPFNPIVQFLYRVTEPILMPIRQYMPRSAIDISPIVAFLIIMFAQQFLVRSLLDIGMRLRAMG